MADIAAWLDQYHVSLASILMTIALLVGASVVIVLLKGLLRGWLGRVEPRLRLRYETVLTITRAVSGALWVIVGMLVLEIWGISLGGFWTLLVSAATIIGVGFLATWTMVSNITASLFLAIWRPFRLGDSIEVLPENLKGRVIDSNLMFVVVREDSGALIQIPNNLFFQKMFRVTGRSDPTLFEVLESGANVGRPTQSG
jgi:small-conductance mechanosensitive channel